MNSSRVVTDQVFASFLDWAHKGAMRRNGRRGRKSEYQEHAKRFDKAYREAALRRLQSQHGAIRQVARLAPSALALRTGAVIVVLPEGDGLRSDGIAHVRAAAASNAFGPVMSHLVGEDPAEGVFVPLRGAENLGRGMGRNITVLHMAGRKPGKSAPCHPSPQF